MAVQGVQDNGTVKGTLDLQDKVRVGDSIITVEDYLKAESRYDADESPNARLAHVLQKANRLPVSAEITTFVNKQTSSWNTSHPVASIVSGDNGATQCPHGTTFVASGERVPNAFCADNKATQTVNGQDPTWYDANGFCTAAGKFLLSYEQHRLAAMSTRSVDVRDSHNWEWVLNSSGDDRHGQIGGFFVNDSVRHYDDVFLGRFNPGDRYVNFAFRCGVSPSPQDIQVRM